MEPDTPRRRQAQGTQIVPRGGEGTPIVSRGRRVVSMNGAMWPSIATVIPAIAARDHLATRCSVLPCWDRPSASPPAWPRCPGRSVAGDLEEWAWWADCLCRLHSAARIRPRRTWSFAALVVFGFANAPLDATPNVVAFGLPKPRRGDVMVRLELAIRPECSRSGQRRLAATRVSVPVHLTIVAVLGILISVIPARSRRRASTRRRCRSAGALTSLATVVVEGRPQRHGQGRVRRFHLLRHRIDDRLRLAALAVVAMAGLRLEAVVPGWSGRYLHTQFGLGPAGYNTGNLAFYVALALAQVLASILLAPHLRYLAVLAGGLLFAGGMTLAVTAQSVPLVVVGLAACGAGAANVQPLAASVAADVFGTDGGVVSRLQTPPISALPPGTRRRAFWPEPTA